MRRSAHGSTARGAGERSLRDRGCAVGREPGKGEEGGRAGVRVGGGARRRKPCWSFTRSEGLRAFSSPCGCDRGSASRLRGAGTVSPVGVVRGGGGVRGAAAAAWSQAIVTSRGAGGRPRLPLSVWPLERPPLPCPGGRRGSPGARHEPRLRSVPPEPAGGLRADSAHRQRHLRRRLQGKDQGPRAAEALGSRSRCGQGPGVRQSPGVGVRAASPRAALAPGSRGGGGAGARGFAALERTKGQMLNPETSKPLPEPCPGRAFPGTAERERAALLSVAQKGAGRLLHCQGQCDEPDSRGLACVKPARFRRTWPYPLSVGYFFPPGPVVVITLGNLHRQPLNF